MVFFAAGVVGLVQQPQNACSAEDSLLKKLMVAASISTLLMQSPALAQERAKMLSTHSGQQLLIKMNGQGRTLCLACQQAPSSQQLP